MTTATLCSPRSQTRRSPRRNPVSQPTLPFVGNPLGARKPSHPVVLQTLPRARTAPVAAESGGLPGRRFARQRLARTVELVGSCIMLLGFLVLAIFA